MKSARPPTGKSFNSAVSAAHANKLYFISNLWSFVIKIGARTAYWKDIRGGPMSEGGLVSHHLFPLTREGAAFCAIQLGTPVICCQRLIICGSADIKLNVCEHIQPASAQCVIPRQYVYKIIGYVQLMGLRWINLSIIISLCSPIETATMPQYPTEHARLLSAGLKSIGDRRVYRALLCELGASRAMH